jgi:soluble lytic murein transglycosylase-like protein
MLASARDEEIRKVEAKLVAKKKPAPAKQSAGTSYGGSRNSRAALYGPIGRGGSRALRRTPEVVPPREAMPIYAQFIKRVNPRLRDAEAMTMAEALVKFSVHFGVDARLVVAMVVVESGFNPNSVSRTGAMGLGQLMPGTAQWMGVHNPFDSVENLYGMVKLIRTHLDQYQDSLELTLAAYNAGIGAVRRHGGVPP